MKRYFFSTIAIFCALTACDEETTKTKQYMVRGQQLYQTYCANCHQQDGSGLGKLYPPLKDSQHLSDKETVICTIKNGMEGEIVVNGQTYDQPMPGIPELKNLDIAEIATFVRITWGGLQIA
ncbi:cytochrome c [Persicobacter sp. CCB-QB2]|uniref:c-type cytochrome n=1 Tax=Persicobacter sp. CCB-QB2 TaxID=1561025 RepID=UPI0006A9F13F|nr:cytochrome c [Persicobacter sp. CCB-QB2]